ncbi:major facilitator superfamily domain-containing protein [Exophiala viscosa]|uniref:Major facilitator superfamily domain-containing protein n=1 Tax=Exophiala viscosa TaxID=2486360 RepID=A0AAN6DSK5_9EURO|nr:major facilitator superfamily domain-containing protein [Exophiala viscosa]
MASNYELKEAPPSQEKPASITGVETTDIAAASFEDSAVKLFLETHQYTAEELAAEASAVRRIVDRRIVPIICITYMIQFLDKLSLNYASAYSLIDDLGLGGHRYAWTAAVFNFGLLFWSIPTTLLLQRFPLAKFTGTMILGWSIVLICHVAARNYAGILVLRFVLGMFEASVVPAVMNLVSMWYTRSEQPIRLYTFHAFNGMATMLGALLAYGLGHSHSSHLKSWKLIFLTIGLLNFVWAWVFLWLMPDSPMSAKFLTHRQQVVAVKRVSENMIGVKNKKFKPRQALEAITDLRVLGYATIGLAGGTINGGVSNFATALIKGYGYSGIQATLLQLPVGGFEFVLIPICGLIATRFTNARCLVLAGVCLIPFGGLLGIRFTSLDHKWTLVGCTWLQYMVGGPVIISCNLLASNVAGHTKRSISNGIYFVFYAAGNIAGANIFFAREKPRYFSAISGLLICYAGIIVVGLGLRLYMQWENKRRDRITVVDGIAPGGIDDAGALGGFNDETDKENLHFRYAL